jgi:polyhydroxyalkanoate synthesis regulator phasin
MIDALKKTLLAGVGAATVSKEKVEAVLGDFVPEPRFSAGFANTWSGFSCMQTNIAAE